MDPHNEDFRIVGIHNKGIRIVGINNKGNLEFELCIERAGVLPRATTRALEVQLEALLWIPTIRIPLL